MKQTLRGNEIYQDKHGDYRYKDDNSYTADHWETKPCGACGLTFTKEGHDPCIGTLPNVINACCGHGIESASYVQFDIDNTIRGKEALDYIEKNKPTNLTRENLKEINNLAELLDLRYGKKGTPSREAFDQSVKDLKSNTPLK